MFLVDGRLTNHVILICFVIFKAVVSHFALKGGQEKKQ